MTDSSIGNTSEEKDSKLPPVSEDEGESEEEAYFLDTNTRTSSKKRSSTGKADRAAKLRKMMDDSDEEMEDADPASLGPGSPPKKNAKPQNTATKPGTDKPEPVAWSDSDSERPSTAKTKAATQPHHEAAPAPTMSTAPTSPRQRRRGKRKVIQKKTVKDDEGYLVTREEAVWESFSEDEPVRAPLPPPAKTQKGKGKGGKGGGGNIMAFFGKK
jgi:DNA polymerase delta subunit 3